MPKQRREGEANGPRGQRPPGASQAGPSWTEFVRPAHQAVVAFAGADMINRAEPRACGHSRGPIPLDSTTPDMVSAISRSLLAFFAITGGRGGDPNLSAFLGARHSSRTWWLSRHLMSAF